MSEKAFGSGYFGEWIEDEFGLPAYSYTCNQINDPKAISPVNETWRLKNDHSHLVGNDRLVGVASNFGYIQVRQDEGAPKFLNDFNPEKKQFAGGFGYLTDGKNIIKTYYNGKNQTFNRIFGVGYYRKIVSGNKIIVDQIVFAPYGDDPLLISQVKVSNNKKDEVNLRWFEYWDSQIYQFSFSAYVDALGRKNVPLAKTIRRDFNKKFTNQFEIVADGFGIQVSKKYKPPLKETIPKPQMEDKKPPTIFLVSLDSLPDGFSTNGDQFFGDGGLESPDGLKGHFKAHLEPSSRDSALIIERKIHLEPKESKILYFVYGYIPDGFELNSLIRKYSTDLDSLLKDSSERWKNNRIKLILPEESWVDRELTWHNYYLRGAMTYDNYFKEHILSQGHVYQYIIGFQGASRDPLQHALPFIYSEPWIAKEIIRYTLKTVRENGSIPYGITGNGYIMPAPFKPSDLELWLLWFISEYIIVNRDLEFLDEIISTYPIYGRKAENASVRELLQRCYKHLTESTGIGRHGILKLSNGDWNDAIVIGNIPDGQHEEIIQQGESILNGAMATHALSKYAEMLDFMGDIKISKEVANFAENQRKFVRKQWTGRWFKRAWLTEDLGWIGEDQMWLEPQPWAIIGGIPNDKQKQLLVQTIDELVRKPSKVGAMIHSTGFKHLTRSLGVGVNAGIWPSINGTLIWALSLNNINLAWDEWKKNTLAMHAEIYPEVWYGIWSGPDTYNSELSEFPGQTIFDPALIKGNLEESDNMLRNIGVNWTDFPVMNLHPHAWPLYNIIHLIGAKITKEGVEFTPKFPKDYYKFSSQVLGFEKSKNGYSGCYNPLIKGRWKITLKVNDIELESLKILEVNGEEQMITVKKGRVVWYGRSEPNIPLRWILKKNL